MEQTDQHYKRLEDKAIHPLDEPLQSSPRDFEVFIKENHVWHDIKKSIEDRIHILTNELIFAEEEKEMYKIQSEIKVWREAIVLPLYLKEWSNIEQTNKEQSDAEHKN